MPKKDKIGYGELTSDKIDVLGKILDMHLNVTQAVLKKHQYYQDLYHYIDLTAGRGSTPDGTLGSPLVFLEKVNHPRFSMSYTVDLIEQELKNLSSLKSSITRFSREKGWDTNNRIRFHHGTYQDVVPTQISSDSRRFGLIFVDPSGDAPDFQLLKLLSELRPKMEILIRLPATNIKRIHHLTGKYLADYMAEIDKKYWLIKKPFSWDHLQWTFLLGTNTSTFSDYAKIDFYRLDSKKAQTFFPKLNLTAKERKNMYQSSFFDLIDDNPNN